MSQKDELERLNGLNVKNYHEEQNRGLFGKVWGNLAMQDGRVDNANKMYKMSEEAYKQSAQLRMISNLYYYCKNGGCTYIKFEEKHYNDVAYNLNFTFASIDIQEPTWDSNFQQTSSH